MRKPLLQRKKPKPVTVEAAQNYRDQGLSYAEIAKRMNLSPSGVYKALNVRKRNAYRRAAQGKPRSVYLTDELWAAVQSAAADADLSASRTVAEILVGARPPVTPEPRIPGV